MTVLDLSVVTLNIGGGEKNFEEYPHDSQKSRQDSLRGLVEHLDAQILCLQEVSQYVDADGLTHSLMEDIQKAGHYDYSIYGPTLSMETHMQVKKDVMVRGIFSDWRDWSKGNAILSRLPFGRLSDPTQPGVPRNIPLYQPANYEGNRDTDPRFALLTRLKKSPFPYLINLHLTTLVGERPPQSSPEKIEEAHHLRSEQIQRLLALVHEYILKVNAPLILAGDFNATRDEFGIAHLLESDHNFYHLMPEGRNPSHEGLEEPIDHIFFYPKERLVDYSCCIEAGELSRRASDHLPVVATLSIK
jgi:endonuclease/exonuclease/phosphatase family metal-dependent hydrolase